MHNPIRLALPVVTLLSLLSLLWLVSPMLSGCTAGQYLQSDPDSVLFMRLFDQSILRGKLLLEDEYGCFPYSMKMDFPPLHMNFLLHFAWFFHALFPSLQADPLLIVGMLPVFFVWLTSLLIVYTLWKISKNPAFVIICSFFLLPGRAAGLVSGFLKLDYDFFISFFIWLWLCNCLLYIHSRRLVSLVAGSIACTLLTLVWAGSPFFFFFVVCQATFSRLMNFRQTSPQLHYASGTLVAGSIPVICYLITSSSNLTISFSRFSYFQPLCILLGGLFLYALSTIENFSWHKMVILLSVPALLLSIGFRDQILQALSFLFHIDPVHRNIKELAPLLAIDPGSNASRILVLSATFGPLFFFVPAWALVKNRAIADSEWLFLRNWLFIFLLLALHQARFLRWLSIGSGLYSGISAYMLFAFFKDKLARFKFKHLELILLFLPFFLFQAFNNNFIIRENKNLLSTEQLDAFRWINENTPQTSGYFDNEKPEYGFLTYRNESNLLAYYSRRPVVVGNTFWGFRTMAEIFSAQSEREAAALCDEYKVRYIFLNTWETYDDDYYNFWDFFRSLPPGPEYKLLNQPIPRSTGFRNWFYFWLRDHLALTPLGNFGITNCFRAIYAAEAAEMVLPPYFVFEKVKGAVLKLRVDPQTTVTISLGLTFNHLKFLYKVRQISDASGNVEFIVPYATGYNSGHISTDQIYKTAFTTDNVERRGMFSVSNQQVQRGSTVSNIQSLVSGKNSGVP